MNEGSSIAQAVSPEQALWKNFQEGNDKALADIYSLYFDQLYNYGFRFTHDVTLVEDCIQELFIKLIRNKQNLSLPGSVKNYLFKAFRSYLFDKMEKLKKYPSQEIHESLEFDMEPHRESAIIQGEEQEARNEQLKTALEQLTPRHREAIFLKYEEGFSYPEIAEMLSLTQKAAYKLVGRAIQTLRSVTIQGFVLYGFFMF
ncbi:MAG TPA: sigma-70 family RNA polymerase sigma factor [Chitinophagaceae bacterium]